MRTQNEGGEILWRIMQTDVSNALFSSVLITARAKTTAPWIGSWWVPTSLTPPRISARTASPSAKSKSVVRQRMLPHFFIYFALDAMEKKR